MFKDKVAIITGAGQGIGFEICRQLARSGASVILNDLDEKLAHDAAAVIEKENGICIPVAGDSAKDTTIKQLIDVAQKDFGKLDIAIANAGITIFSDFLNYKREDFQTVLRVNMEGTFFLAQAAARVMKEQGSGGRILFMSSVTGHQAHKNLSAYGMTKAAIEMLARTLVIELSQYGITVNAIAPGATLNQRTMNDPSYKETWSRLTPLGKPALTTDIADAATFLVSDKAGHITGQTLVVDGGWSCISPSPYD
jgi:glucose 1-dehydrogenase